MNKVVLIGRLAKDPELRFAAGSGNAVSRFSVAIPRQFKKEETDFINCVAFGKTAETISQYLTKGKQIALEGRIQTGSYDKNGTKVYTTDVAVERFEFIGDNKSSGNNNGVGSNSGFSNNSDTFNGGYDGMEQVDDGSMPF